MLSVKRNGAHKKSNSIMVKKDGEWKQGIEMLVKVDGEWKKAWKRSTVIRTTNMDQLYIPIEGAVDEDSVLTLYNARFRVIDPETNKVVGETVEESRVVGDSRKTVFFYYPDGYYASASFRMVSGGRLDYRTENNPKKHILEYEYVSFSVVP